MIVSSSSLHKCLKWVKSVSLRYCVILSITGHCQQDKRINQQLTKLSNRRRRWKEVHHYGNPEIQEDAASHRNIPAKFGSGGRNVENLRLMNCYNRFIFCCSRSTMWEGSWRHLLFRTTMGSILKVSVFRVSLLALLMSYFSHCLLSYSRIYINHAMSIILWLNFSWFKKWHSCKRRSNSK